MKIFSLFLALQENIKNYSYIFNNDTLERLARELPCTLNDLETIEGIPTAKRYKYGNRILEVTKKYVAKSSKCDLVLLKHEYPEFYSIYLGSVEEGKPDTYFHFW